MIAFNTDYMFINDSPIPVDILFNYTPLEISYICFVYGYDCKILTSMIFKQLKCMRCDIPTTDLYGCYALTISSLLDTYSFPLSDSKLLKHIMLKHNYDDNDIRILTLFNSVNMIEELNKVNIHFGHYEPYINPDASLRQLIDINISNHPNDTVSLLYYQHKYVILGLSTIYFKLKNIPNWLKYIIDNWFDVCKIESDTYTEAFQTLNYLINFEAFEWERILLYFESLSRLFICKNVIDNLVGYNGMKNMTTDLYRCAGLSDNEISMFASNKRETVTGLIHNLNIISNL